MSIITCDSLCKTYRRAKALDSLTVRFEENRITGLIGRNGAGKTTLLKLAAGCLRPTGGQITVFGQKPFNNLTVSAQTIFVDDGMAFPQTFNLGELIGEMPHFYPNFDKGLALKLTDYFSLDKRQHTAKLSKGMRSTFCCIIGLAARVPLTLFDEPTTGMDAAVRKDFYRALLKEYIAHPRTIVLSSHLLSELSTLLEDIVLIDSGHLVEQMTAQQAEGMAAGLRGSEQAVRQIAGERPILHREEFAPGSVFTVVKGELSPKETRLAADFGVELLPVKADELCIYLTEKNKGGIDDVFAG